MSIVTIGLIAIGWILGGLSWVWTHLQSGPLVAILLILLVLNMRVGQAEAVYSDRIEELEERIEELESGDNSGHLDDDDI